MSERGYLLDTQTIVYWWDDKRVQHKHVLQRIESLPKDTYITMSSVSIGEIEYGHRIAPNKNSRLQQKSQREFEEFLRKQFMYKLEITEATGSYFGELRSKLFSLYAPKNDLRALRPEQLTNPMSSQQLGIQENDLWIAAQSLQYDLILVTHDKMNHIRQAAADGLGLTVEDWTCQVQTV